ncbi:MAG TPA: hypothetical protein VNP96_11330 [Solirubrobacterales bacterium]|nr:hypothetical protein [Solirubrobacterales bacterium]
MINRKALGLSLVAAFTMSAAVASPAHAQFAGFEAGGYPATITGAQIGLDEFSTKAGSASCTHATYHGEISGPSSSLTLSPTYSGCKAFGLFNATIDMNGCDYVVRAGGTWGLDDFIGTMDIFCEFGKSIAITTSVCRVTIPAQNNLFNVTYRNTAFSPDDVDMAINVDFELEYTVDSGCFTASPGTSTSGSMRSDATLGADNFGWPEDFTVSH